MINKNKSKWTQDRVKTDKLAIGSLNPTPEFYKSVPNNPSINRFRSLGIRINTPFITEILKGRVTSLNPFRINFRESFKRIPLVLGLLTKVSDGKTIQIFPDNEYIRVVTRTYIELNPNFVFDGDRYKLRVYNLDLQS